MKNYHSFTQFLASITQKSVNFYTTAGFLKNQNLPKHPKNTLKSPISPPINLLKDSLNQPKTSISLIWQRICQIAKFPQETFL